MDDVLISCSYLSYLPFLTHFLLLLNRRSDRRLSRHLAIVLPAVLHLTAITYQYLNAKPVIQSFLRFFCQLERGSHASSLPVSSSCPTASAPQLSLRFLPECRRPPVKQHEDPELPRPYITESTSLLNSKQETPCEADPRTRGAVWSALTALMVAALVVLLFFQDSLPDRFAPWLGTLPKDPLLAALKILETAPVIVSHTGSLHIKPI